VARVVGLTELDQGRRQVVDNLPDVAPRRRTSGTRATPNRCVASSLLSVTRRCNAVPRSGISSNAIQSTARNRAKPVPTGIGQRNMGT